ncbi:MAG TPA: hypothetical protein VIP09_07885 [Dehalococcoidia bacterium]|jgi:hypothetical protein
MLGLACRANGDDLPAAVATATPTAPAASFTATAAPITASSATPIPTTVWKRFTNTDYGFSFQYPAGWYLDVHGSRPDTTMDYVAISNLPTDRPGTATFLPGTFRIEFYIGDRDGLSLEDWVLRNREPLGDEVKVVTSEPLVIDGNEGLEQTRSYYCCDASSDTPLYVDFFKAGNFVLMAGGPSIDSPDLPIYRQIVQSLTFED